MTVRVVLVDDHPIFLDGLRGLLEVAEGYKVVACCRDSRDALDAIESHRPDIVVLDLKMPRLDGIGLLKEIEARQLPVRTILLTAELDEPQLLEAVRLKVRGVVLKEMAPRLLLQCLDKVAAGGQWLEHRSMQNALEGVLRRQAGREKAQQELTQREITLVCLVADGLRNKEIATRLNISEGTVKTHLRNIYRKLHRETRVALRQYAEERGLI
jgi:DNA-binding NarL/FixJ family response regulator